MKSTIQNACCDSYYTNCTLTSIAEFLLFQRYVKASPVALYTIPQKLTFGVAQCTVVLCFSWLRTLPRKMFTWIRYTCLPTN
jgi:hypothetical protein